jgi:hypothetical protein
VHKKQKREGEQCGGSGECDARLLLSEIDRFGLGLNPCHAKPPQFCFEI